MMSLCEVASDIHLFLRNAEIVSENMIEIVTASQQIILKDLHLALDLVKELTGLVTIL